MIVSNIPIEQIRHRPDARLRTDEALKPLEDSIRDIGLLNPITVRQLNGGFEVVAGSHRLQVCDLLGWTEVPCMVLNLDDLHAELAMIDENLIRAELSPAERAKQTDRRKALYVALHPATRHGNLERFATADTDEASMSQSLRLGESLRFSIDTAARTGQSERKVQLDAERGEKVDHAALDAVAGTPLDRGTYLDTLKRLPREQQLETAQRHIAAGCRPGGIAGRYASAPATSSNKTLFISFLKAADWFDQLDTQALLISAGRQQSRVCQRARGIADKLETMLEGVNR